MWIKSFHSESFLIQFRIWNNSSSWFMCSTSRTSVSPFRITSHRSICCNQHLLSSNNSNKSCVQQSSSIHIEPNLYKCCGCHGVMFSEVSYPAEMTRFLVCTVLYRVQEWSQNASRMSLIGGHGTGVCTVLCMNQSWTVSILMYSFRNMQHCTQECRIWGESAHYTKRMQWNVITMFCYNS